MESIQRTIIIAVSLSIIYTTLLYGYNVSKATRAIKESSFTLTSPTIANEDSINRVEVVSEDPLIQNRVAVVGFPGIGGIYQGIDINSCSKLPPVHLTNYSVSITPHSVWANGLNGTIEGAKEFPCWCFEMMSTIFAPDLLRLPFSWSVPGWIESKGTWYLKDPQVDYPFEQEAVDVLCTYDVIISTGPTHLPPCPKKMVQIGYEKKLVDNWQYRLYMPLEPDWDWLNFDLNKWGNWCSVILWNYGHVSWERMISESKFSANLLPHLRKPKLSGIYFHYVYDLLARTQSQNADWRLNNPIYDHTKAKVLVLRRNSIGPSRGKNDIKSRLTKEKISFESKTTWKNCSELHKYLALVDVGEWLSANQFAVDAAMCKTISISTKYRLFQTLIHHPDLVAKDDEAAMVLIKKLKNNPILRDFYINYSQNNLHYVNLTQHQISISTILERSRKSCPLIIENV
jgi:hypothetical protein